MNDDEEGTDFSGEATVGAIRRPCCLSGPIFTGSGPRPCTLLTGSLAEASMDRVAGGEACFCALRWPQSLRIHRLDFCTALDIQEATGWGEGLY